MSITSSRADAAELAQARIIALGDKVETTDEHLHRRIETVFLTQLDRQAFGEVAGADTSWLECLNESQNFIDTIERRAKA